jgi:chorismate synthase
MQALRLYEITDALMELMDNPEATDEQLEAAFGALTDKAGGVAAVIKNYDATIEAIKNENRRLGDIKKRMESRQAWLEEYTIRQMEKLDVTELTSGVHTLKLRNNPPAVKIDNEALIPQFFFNIVQTITPNKKAIAEELKAGYSVEGCHLESGRSLIIK